MKISREEIEHIAELARLTLSEEEKDLFGLQLSGILDYMDKLNELNTGDVEPTSSLAREDALQNAPSRTEKFYRVPKIIE